MAKTISEERSLPQDARDRSEYLEGKHDFLFEPDSKCPYAEGQWGRRTAWWTGYLDARTNDRLGDVFKRMRITFP